jgi:hypothetical protein
LLSPGSYPFNASANATAGYSPGGQIGNPDLKWESGNSTNFGFDAGFLNSRINITADYYYKKVTDLIFPQVLPGTTGGKTIVTNIPGNDINKGFEFSIDGAIVRQHDFGWDMNLNMSFNNNKMTGLTDVQVYPTGYVSLGGGGGPPLQIIKNGYSLGTFWGYVAQGVDPQTGNEKFSNDPTNLGSALPKFTYGIAENLRYKAFSLSLLFDGVYGNKVYDVTRQETDQLNGAANESTAVLARWETAGQVTSVPTAINNGTTNSSAINFLNTNSTSYYLESGAFFRLRNATLSYNIDPGLLKRIGVQRARLFVTGQNVFMITKYKGYTPDVNSYGNGTNNKPGNVQDGGPTLLSLGIDDGAYPAARIYTIGINVQF